MRQGLDYEVGRADLALTPRGAIAGRGGLLKLIFLKADRKLVGVHCIGDIASEIVGIGQMVIRCGGTMNTIANMSMNTPTYSYAYKYAAFDGLRRLRSAERQAVGSMSLMRRSRVSQTKHSGRTYNQLHVPRKYTPGKRRFSVYWTWSYPWEANRDVTELDNRFSTMTEVRRVAWPNYETVEYSEKMFLQGIAGTLELFHLSLVSFQTVVGEVTGHPVAVYQRIDQAGQRLPIDERILDDTDTLMVFGLDHLVTEQEASAGEIEAVRHFLTREGTCLILGPHHDVGVSADLKERAMEYAHHGDPLVPRQQRFGKYTRSLMKGLGVPVENRYGLRPATVPGTTRTSSSQRREGPGHSRLARRRRNVQLPYAPAALCGHHRRSEGDPRAGAAAGRCIEAASVRRGRQPRVQHVPLDAANAAHAPATYCWQTRRSSRLCSAATRAWSASGKTSPSNDGPCRRQNPVWPVNRFLGCDDRHASKCAESWGLSRSA